MIRLASGISYADLQFRQTPRIIATVVIQGAGGVVLIDPGPTSTLPTLRQELKDSGISSSDVTTILLTHIHLDHAGSTGTLVHESPRIRVYVDERGAPHMVDPTKLVASATRLYGDDMERLWGEIRPLPPASLTALRGGERIDAGGRTLLVEHTPGHANHHVSYFSPETGLAFVGDTAGIKRTPSGYVLPPTPPPDIDIESWEVSLTRIGAWHPETLFLTHCGPASPVGAHLAEFRENLAFVLNLVRTSLDRDGDDESRESWFTDQVRLELERRHGIADARNYEVAGRFDLNWRGLARYLRKRQVRS